MEHNFEKYGLDLHCSMILEEYNESLCVFEKMKSIVEDTLAKKITENGIYVTAIEARVKKEKSLAGKLELKGAKYASLSEITDILGTRVITFYTEEVDKIAALVDRVFEIDWINSVDKRKKNDLSSFGYQSLHYICRIPKSLYYDPKMPMLNEYRFEIQMRTALQHVWATIEHDLGYKSGIAVPQEYLRNIHRLAGLLELADEQFSITRTSIINYRRKVENFVRDGKFEEAPLDEDTFRRYLAMKPFEQLSQKIASINQAEIHMTSSMPYLTVLKEFGFKTLADVENLKQKHFENAYQLAVFQMGNTDLDIIASTVAIQNLLIVYILDNGFGEQGLITMFECINGKNDYNKERAHRVYEAAQRLSFMHNKE